MLGSLFSFRPVATSVAPQLPIISDAIGIDLAEALRLVCAMFNRIGVLRKARNLSRHDVATAVGANPQTIGCLERGDYGPSLELGMRIARLLDRPVEAVFSPEPFAD